MLESFLLSMFRRLPPSAQASFLDKTSKQPAVSPADFAMDLGDFLALAYGPHHRLDESELQRVRLILGKESVKSIHDARAVIMALDQQKYPTPMLIRFSAEDVSFTQVNGISCAVDRHDMSTSAYGAHWREYEPNLVACFRKICKEGSVVCDIGANVGFHSLMLSALAGPAGQVYAFEPNSENCRLILLGAEHNRASNITLLPVAVSDCRG
jgi:tRNA G37 N-methylase Trm5